MTDMSVKAQHDLVNAHRFLAKLLALHNADNPGPWIDLSDRLEGDPARTITGMMPSRRLRVLAGMPDVDKDEAERLMSDVDAAYAQLRGRVNDVRPELVQWLAVITLEIVLVERVRSSMSLVYLTKLQALVGTISGLLVQDFAERHQLAYVERAVRELYD